MQQIDELLAQLPLHPTWLEMIVNYLDEIYGNEASVHLIARGIPPERRNEATEETITRTINFYCPDADDFKEGNPEYFRRVKPTVYRLVLKPSRAEIWNLRGRVEQDDWTDYGHWQGWNLFKGTVNKEHREKWVKMNTADRLAAFAQNLDKPQLKDFIKGSKPPSSEL